MTGREARSGRSFQLSIRILHRRPPAPVALMTAAWGAHEREGSDPDDHYQDDDQRDLRVAAPESLVAHVRWSPASAKREPGRGWYLPSSYVGQGYSPPRK